MKLLIISKDSWNTQNSFGNTFSNLFCGMSNVEIYNICCHSDFEKTELIKSTLQVTDRSVFECIFQKKIDPCIIQTDEIHQVADTDIGAKFYGKSIARNTFSYIARDFIWKLGRWKKSETLIDFLDKIKPDVIYLPIYSFWYMCDFQDYIIDKLGIPVVGHISDDIYGDLHTVRSPLKRFYIRILRKKLRKIISKCAYLEVFAENMQCEYEKLFNKKCYLIGKGIDFSRQRLDNLSMECNTAGNEFTFLYTGNLGLGRYKVLCNIAKELDNCKSVKKAVLKVFSATQLDKTMRKAFAKYSSLKFCGQISYKEVVEQQNKADYLVFVEDFSKANISAVRMSFSTKIIDYMMAEKPIFAVGPNEIYPVQMLRSNKLAIVSSSEIELKENVKSILSGKANESFYVNNSIKYLKEKRDIRTIQKGMFERMQMLINDEKGCQKP